VDNNDYYVIEISTIEDANNLEIVRAGDQKGKYDRLGVAYS
jgi:hypothetical protein